MSPVPLGVLARSCRALLCGSVGGVACEGCLPAGLRVDAVVSLVPLSDAWSGDFTWNMSLFSMWCLYSLVKTLICCGTVFS